MKQFKKGVKIMATKGVKLENRDKPATPRQKQAINRWLRDGKIHNTSITMGECSTLLQSLINWQQGLLDKSDLEKSAIAKKYGLSFLRLKEDKGDQQEIPDTPPVPVKEEEIIKVKDIQQDNQKDQLLQQLKLLLKDDLYEELIRVIEAQVPAIPVIPLPQDDNYIKPDFWDKIYKALSSDYIFNVLLYGVSGGGKTMFCQYMAEALTLEFFPFICTSGMSFARLFGGKSIKENGETYWECSDLIEAIQRPCLILLDELTTLDEGLAKGLNSILEVNQRYLQTPLGLIRVHEKTRFIATSNTGGRGFSKIYTGDNRQDESLLNRFLVKHRVDYDARVETEIVNRYGKANIYEMVIGLREKLQSNRIEFDASTRLITACCQLACSGFSDNEAFDMSFLQNLSETELKAIGM
jgi:hypothetical protein